MKNERKNGLFEDNSWNEKIRRDGPVRLRNHEPFDQKKKIVIIN